MQKTAVLREEMRSQTGGSYGRERGSIRRMEDRAGRHSPLRSGWQPLPLQREGQEVGGAAPAQARTRSGRLARGCIYHAALHRMPRSQYRPLARQAPRSRLRAAPPPEDFLVAAAAAKPQVAVLTQSPSSQF